MLTGSLPRVCVCVYVCVCVQVPVDVMGVVVSVGSSGTVKRKSDSSELARRDITLADKR